VRTVQNVQIVASRIRQKHTSTKGDVKISQDPLRVK
jgi:hypothetical protein